ncbi:hypothetical protein [Streptomyces antimycoticus]|uniref:hypothetical protein n=1 Tax=Streptomyces antimycoticus TaxID=68175 RepID=UPI001F3A2ECD|nr:hypothetical protein [Streptomyces antimycoticus]
MINSIACTIPRPTGGILDDFEEEDDQRGYEDEPEARLWAYLDRLVREADARIAAGRPRHTVGLTSGRLVIGADQRCGCGKPADQCRCKDPYPAGRGYQLGDLLARMVREADSRIPAERRVRRTLQEMLPYYERQPVLVLHRPTMDMCPLCERFNCSGSDCPPPSVAPALAGVAKVVVR